MARRRRTRSPFAVFTALGIVSVFLLGALLRFLASWHWVWCYLAAVSLTVFFYYGIDKALARSQARRRIPEKTLHFFALIGGTPGAFLGQQLFRHKTVKSRFRLVFWLVVVFQLGLVGVWLWWS